jgi:NTP pyrophosphatase (non-canonical NTP hydrolase)
MKFDKTTDGLHRAMVFKLKKTGMDINNEMTDLKADLMHMCAGVCDEAGELLSPIKKHVFYNKPLDMKNIIEELGDLEFYMEGIRQALRIKRKDVLDYNREKLMGVNGRYKEGKYTDEQAQLRRDKQEDA